MKLVFLHRGSKLNFNSGTSNLSAFFDKSEKILCAFQPFFFFDFFVDNFFLRLKLGGGKTLQFIFWVRATMGVGRTDRLGGHLELLSSSPVSPRLIRGGSDLSPLSDESSSEEKRSSSDEADW